jgi:hypothetical protein
MNSTDLIAEIAAAIDAPSLALDIQNPDDRTLVQGLAEVLSHNDTELDQLAYKEWLESPARTPAELARVEAMGQSLAGLLGKVEAARTEESRLTLSNMVEELIAFAPLFWDKLDPQTTQAINEAWMEHSLIAPYDKETEDRLESRLYGAKTNV